MEGTGVEWRGGEGMEGEGRGGQGRAGQGARWTFTGRDSHLPSLPEFPGVSRNGA